MTHKKQNMEVQEVKTSPNQIMQGLESELSALINDENSGLSDLKSFAKNLTKEKSEKSLTQHNVNIIKKDLQNGGLVDFEPGTRNNKPFGFEVIGNDIEPTITPNGDCLIPINFRYDSQRRTKLLILHIEDKNGQNVYSIPNGDNEYLIEIGKENWLYCLQQDKNGFHIIIKK